MYGITEMRVSCNAPGRSDSRRASAAQIKKWYRSKQWLRLRERQLRRYPYCQCPHHDGRKLRADDPRFGGPVVDHHEPHKGDARLFFDPRNLRSMTKQCHDRFKQSAEKGGSGFLKGSDERGMPLDKTSEWYDGA